MQFTLAEQRKMLRSLKRRYPKSRYPTIRSIGLGAALAKGLPDVDRGIVVCFYVSEKKTPRDKRQRIDPAVSFRLYRRGRWRTVTLPTDVISLQYVQATGGRVNTFRTPGVPDRCTAGVLVQWTEGGSPRTGGMTVGHSLMFPGAAQNFLTVKVGGVQVGTVRARVPLFKEIDLGIFEFTNRLPFTAVSGPVTATGPAILPYSAIGFPNPLPGKSYRPVTLGGVVDFSTGGYVPALTFDHHGTALDVKHLVRADSTQDMAFGPERSGSAWVRMITDAAGNVSEHLFAIQVAGDPSNNFKTGYGQLLTEITAEPFVSDAVSTLQGQIGGSPVMLAGYC